jgi:hypothetical protein
VVQNAQNPFSVASFSDMAIPASSFAQFGVSITIAPPALPVYTQPMVPAAGYLWTPGYWSYGDEGYFWVPGTWVEPPTVACSGLLVIGVGAATPSPGMKATGVQGRLLRWRQLRLRLRRRRLWRRILEQRSLLLQPLGE